jgi:hypothetical protein
MTNAGIFQHKEPHQRNAPKLQSGTVDRGLCMPPILRPFLEIAAANGKFFGSSFCDCHSSYRQFST